jgi:hypothetical protein
MKVSPVYDPRQLLLRRRLQWSPARGMCAFYLFLLRIGDVFSQRSLVICKFGSNQAVHMVSVKALVDHDPFCISEEAQ